MPARLVVTAGATRGREHWIEEDVIRIGHDPRCEVRVEEPGLAAFAAALEFADGRYTVYNQSDSPMILAGRELAPRASAAWTPGQELTPTKGVTLRLVADDKNRAPGHRPAAPVAVESAAQSEPTPAGAKAPASKLRDALQIAVIGLCLVGMAAMVALQGKIGAEPVARDPSTDFAACLESLADDGRQDLRRNLQDARRAELRDELATARRSYARVRDQVLALHPDGDFSKDKAGEMAARFAAARLLVIEARLSAAAEADGGMP